MKFKVEGSLMVALCFSLLSLSEGQIMTTTGTTLGTTTTSTNTTYDTTTGPARMDNTTTMAPSQVQVDITAAVISKAQECFESRVQRAQIMKQAMLSMVMGNMEDQSSKLKCTSKCVMQSYGVMDVNGGIQPQTIRILVNMIENPVVKQMALSRVDSCIEGAGSIQDPCQKSASVLMCIAKNGLVSQLLKGVSASASGNHTGNSTADGDGGAGVMGDISKAVGSKAKECFESRLERARMMKKAMKSIMKGNLEEESSKMKCTSKCVMQSFGVMDENGGLQPQTIRKLVEKTKNPFVRKVALERVDCCIDLAKSMEDSCQKSAFVVMCIAKNGLMNFANAKDRLKSIPALLSGKPQNCTGV